MNDLKFTAQPLKQDWDQELPRYWFDNSTFKSHFMNALGVNIPSGETFLLVVVKHFKETIEEPELQEAIKQFIAQENWHQHSHTAYNDWLQKIGLLGNELLEEARLRVFVTRNTFSPKQLLSLVVGIEHNTAVFMEYFLKRPHLLAQMHPHFRQIWMWHAIEEIEHKGVAFDMWNTLKIKLNYKQPLRFVSFLIGSGVFNYRVLKITLLLLRKDKQLWKWRTFKDGATFLLGVDGLLWNTILPYFEYAKPSFHPWDHDSRPVLDKYSKLL